MGSSLITVASLLMVNSWPILDGNPSNQYGFGSVNKDDLESAGLLVWDVGGGVIYG